MLAALLAALVAVNVAYLVLMDRKDHRDREERAVLLQRIQAPEQAVYEHAVKEQEVTENPLPLTDEQVALLQEMEALKQMDLRQQVEYENRIA